MILKVQEAKTLWQKVRGLIGRKPYPLLFKTRFGLHTFGMLYPIDVIILDNDSRVVAVKENIKPSRMYFWNPIYDTLIELPEGFVRKEKIKIGEKINLDF